MGQIQVRHLGKIHVRTMPVCQTPQPNRRCSGTFLPGTVHLLNIFNPNSYCFQKKTNSPYVQPSSVVSDFQGLISLSTPRSVATVRCKVWTGETNGIPNAVRNGFKPRIKIQVWVDVDTVDVDVKKTPFSSFFLFLAKKHLAVKRMWCRDRETKT